jgi:hypothetical protein
MAVEGINVNSQGMSGTKDNLEITWIFWNNLEVAGLYPFLKSYCLTKKPKK